MASRLRWKLHEIHKLLNRRLLEVAGGTCPRLMVNCPSQIGKSVLVSVYFCAWLLLTRPDTRIVLISYEAEHATHWGRRVRDIIDEFGQLFGVRLKDDSRRADWFELTAGGMMFCAGSKGAALGKSADYIIIDDPHKPEEANSETIREQVFDTYQTTLRSRLSERGAIVIIATRFNSEDLCGKLLANADEGGDKWTHVRLPALAEEREEWETGWVREPGDSICPELKSKEWLEQTKRGLDPWIWQTVWQQNPYIRGGGGIFPARRIEIANSIPPGAVTARAWDLAGSEGKGDFTAGVRLSKWLSAFYLADVIRIREAPGRRDEIIRATAERDGRRCTIIIERAPGEAGKTSELHFQRLLQGFHVVFQSPQGSKTQRAEALASACWRGEVATLNGPWLEDLLYEAECFPGGRHDDQIDAACMAYGYLLDKRGYVTDKPRTSRTCCCMRTAGGQIILRAICPVHRTMESKLDTVLPRVNFRDLFGGR